MADDMAGDSGIWHMAWWPWFVVRGAVWSVDCGLELELGLRLRLGLAHIHSHILQQQAAQAPVHFSARETGNIYNYITHALCILTITTSIAYCSYTTLQATITTHTAHSKTATTKQSNQQPEQ
jgi:hypothetical protein